MNRVVGGGIPADIWRRFMLTAHEGLPAREFAGLGPPAETPRQRIVRQRSDFYSGLASEFAREADEPPAPAIEEPLEEEPQDEPPSEALAFPYYFEAPPPPRGYYERR
jgi:penicillin-binding protein 1A